MPRLLKGRQHAGEDFEPKVIFVAQAVGAALDHPDLVVGYSRCEVHYSTHAIDGLSENDFICAAKIDALLQTGNQ